MLLDENFRIMGIKKWYESIEEMQKDIDKYIHLYNYERTHQGRNMNGRTPYKAFVDGKVKPKTDNEGELKKAA